MVVARLGEQPSRPHRQGQRSRTPVGIGERNGGLVDRPAGAHDLFAAALVVNLTLNQQQLIRDVAAVILDILNDQPRWRADHRLRGEPPQVPEVPARIADIVETLIGFQSAAQR